MTEEAEAVQDGHRRRQQKLSPDWGCALLQAPLRPLAALCPISCLGPGPSGRHKDESCSGPQILQIRKSLRALLCKILENTCGSGMCSEGGARGTAADTQNHRGNVCTHQPVSYFKFHTNIQTQANNRRVFVILVSSKAAEFKTVQRASAGCRLGVKSLFGLEGKQK